MYSFDIMIDALSYVRWSFWLNDNVLYLDSYIMYVRESSRHKYRGISGYNRLDHRNSGFKMKLDEVPLTEDIKKKALDTIVNSIVFNKCDKK